MTQIEMNAIFHFHPECVEVARFWYLAPDLGCGFTLNHNTINHLPFKNDILKTDTCLIN